jgi:hypothetical protein
MYIQGQRTVLWAHIGRVNTRHVRYTLCARTQIWTICARTIQCRETFMISFSRFVCFQTLSIIYRNKLPILWIFFVRSTLKCANIEFAFIMSCECYLRIFVENLTKSFQLHTFWCRFIARIVGDGIGIPF